jgi:hypothetical protein
VPNVQITPILGGQYEAFRNFWLYHLHPTGGPAVDESGFYLGICGDTGQTINFEYLAIAVYTAGDE